VGDEKIAKFEQDYYNGKYFEADKTGGKEYSRPDGSVEKWGYACKQLWSGWSGIIKPLKLLFRPRKVLDVGCGCGSFVREARKERVKAWGVDFSEYAIENALDGAERWVSVGDARDIPYPEDSFDFVLSTDLMEHIYLEGDSGRDVDLVIDELYRVSSKWIFLQISTPTGDEGFPDGGFILKKGEPIPIELEVYAVAGHVTVMPYEWWEKRLQREGWRLRPDLVDKFRRLVDPPALIGYWRTIFICEKWP